MGLGETLGRLARADYWFFLREILGYNWLDPWLHGEELVRFCVEHDFKDCLLLVPRGSGKTGCITAPVPAWWIARDPFGTFSVCNAAEAKASQMAAVSAAIIKNNQKYRLAFPEIVPSSKWGEQGYRVDTPSLQTEDVSVERVDFSLKGIGVGGNLTGAHQAGLINDDLITSNSYRSPAKLAEARGFYIESLNCVDPGAYFVCIGTRWTFNDFYGELESGALTGKTGKMNVLKMGVYQSDGSLIWPKTTYVDQRGARKEVGYGEDEVRSFKTSLGNLFSALYLNEPMTDEDRPFDVEATKTYKSLADLPFDLGGIGLLGIEAESQAVSLIQSIRDIARGEARQLKMMQLTSKKVSKDIRINSTVGNFLRNIAFNVRDDLWRGDFGKQMREYPLGHDDLLDAASYAIGMSRDSDDRPQVYIGVDPAFSISEAADFTAIVAACRFRGEAYILDAKCFRTSKLEIQAREIFKMYDKFNSSGYAQKKAVTKISGFTSIGNSRRGGRRRNRSLNPYRDNVLLEPED